MAMCYKDRWWCAEKDCVNIQNCDRFLTEEHHKLAIKRKELIQFKSKPECYRQEK